MADPTTRVALVRSMAAGMWPHELATHLQVAVKTVEGWANGSRPLTWYEDDVRAYLASWNERRRQPETLGSLLATIRPDSGD